MTSERLGLMGVGLAFAIACSGGDPGSGGGDGDGDEMSTGGTADTGSGGTLDTGSGGTTGGTEASGGTPATGGGDMGTGGMGPDLTGCDIVGFEGVQQAAYYNTDLDTTYFNDRSTAGQPFDALQLNFFHFLGGADSPEMITFTGENYETCGNCALMFSGCTSEGCPTRYLADSGTLDLTVMDGSRIAGTITDARFVEVTIDDSFVSTEVPGGDTWCVPSYSFDTDL